MNRRHFLRTFASAVVLAPLGLAASARAYVQSKQTGMANNAFVETPEERWREWYNERPSTQCPPIRNEEHQRKLNQALSETLDRISNEQA